MKVMHKHRWQYIGRGQGELPKSNTPEKKYINGHLEQCLGCDKKRFAPDNPEMPYVEVEE